MSSEGSPLVPPPAAMQKVSDRHESEVKPPPGGSAVNGSVQPGASRTGAGTVVGTADGGPVVVDIGALVVVVALGAGGR